MLQHHKEFKVAFKDTELVGDILPAEQDPRILFLHGAGSSNRRRYDYFRLPLAEDGIASVAFDSIGHGDTGGVLEGSNLAERTEQARAVIDSALTVQPFGIMAGSMGAYTAIKLTKLYPIDRLVLMVPAVYNRDLYSVPFGPQFKEKVQQPKSWENSDAWDILGSYTGKLLLVVAENDGVVPKEIPERIYQAAVNAKNRELYVVNQASHQIREYLVDPTHKNEFNDCYQRVKQTLED